MYWYVAVRICWYLDMLVYWYIDLGWHRDPIPKLRRHIDMLVCWCIDTLLYHCTHILMWWCVAVSIDWHVEMLVCWYVIVRWHTIPVLRRNIDLDIDVRWHKDPIPMFHVHLDMLMGGCIDISLYYCMHILLQWYVAVSAYWHMEMCVAILISWCNVAWICRYVWYTDIMHSYIYIWLSWSQTMPLYSLVISCGVVLCRRLPGVSAE